MDEKASALGEKTTIVNDDQFYLVDSEEVNPLLRSKRIKRANVRRPAIIVTAVSFTGNNAPAIAALSGLTPDTGFLVFSGGTLLDNSLGQYTFAGTTITIPTGAATLRIVIL